eukprot:12518599-Ditylum_brightwellii.AAC.1
MERSKQNKHVACNKDNDVDDGVDDGVDNDDNDGVDDGDDGDDSADKHLIPLSQAADCCLMERSKQNKHVNCNKDYDVDDDVDNGVDHGDNDSVDNGDDPADKHLIHHSQAAGCCMIERSKQNKHVSCNKDDDVDDGVDDGVDNGDNDGVEDGDDGVDNSNEYDDKNLTHLSQAADCCLMERSKQNTHVVCIKDNDVDNFVDNGDNDSVDN